MAIATSASGWKCIVRRSEEHTSELQSQSNLVCRLLLQKNNPCEIPHDPNPGRRSVARDRAVSSLGFYPSELRLWLVFTTTWIDLDCTSLQSIHVHTSSV